MAVCQANACLQTNRYLNLSFMFVVQLTAISMIYKYRTTLCPFYLNNDYKYINWYLRWTYILIVAGFVVAENYIEYKQLLIGAISLLVPILWWLFCRPPIAQYILRGWYKYAWIPFILLFLKPLGFNIFYLQPILILGCLFSLYKKRTSIIIVILILLMATDDIEESRAPFIKGMIAIFTGITIYFRHKLSNRIIRIGRVFCFLCSLGAFTFVLQDAYNFVLGRINANDAVENNQTREKISKDTRSLLYVDLVTSAIENNYIVWGHTPARGFEITYSGILFMNSYDDLKVFNKGERHKNEMVLSNVLTWEGLIGLVLFSLIYIRGTYLAVYSSRNKIIPILACFVAWRWSWGWIEDTNNFLITDIDLWVLMAICYSPYFREMSEKELTLLARGLLSAKYQRYNNTYK